MGSKKFLILLAWLGVVFPAAPLLAARPSLYCSVELHEWSSKAGNRVDVSATSEFRKLRRGAWDPTSRFKLASGSEKLLKRASAIGAIVDEKTESPRFLAMFYLDKKLTLQLSFPVNSSEGKATYLRPDNDNPQGGVYTLECKNHLEEQQEETLKE